MHFLSIKVEKKVLNYSITSKTSRKMEGGSVQCEITVCKYPSLFRKMTDNFRLAKNFIVKYVC